MPQSNKPVYCVGCGSAVFCKSCIQKWCQRQNNCPYCKRNRVQFVSCAKNPKIKEVYDSTLITCQQTQCNELCTLSSVEFHESIYCRKASCNQCNKQIEPNFTMKAHQALACPK